MDPKGLEAVLVFDWPNNPPEVVVLLFWLFWPKRPPPVLLLAPPKVEPDEPKALPEFVPKPVPPVFEPNTPDEEDCPNGPLVLLLWPNGDALLVLL